MRPFFPFYGSKWRTAKYYPIPRYSTVIEPFAGSAGYSTYYGPENVILVDKDPIIAGVWRYLIGATEAEIESLPDVEPGEDVRSLGLPPEAAWLIGFWLNRGSATPKRRRTAYSSRNDKYQLNWGERAKERIISQLPKIRHWEVYEQDYREIDYPGSATWFIDPPYEVKGRYYRHREIDYRHLCVWSLTSWGQVIACENEGASWLPFWKLQTIKSSKGISREVVYTQ